MNDIDLLNMKSCKDVYFKNLVPSDLSEVRAIYCIYDEFNSPLYVGRTTNLRRRVYTNHLQGNSSTARLKKYLVEDESFIEVNNYSEAKYYIKENCFLKYLKLDSSISDHDYKLLENKLTYLINPKYLD